MIYCRISLLSAACMAGALALGLSACAVPAGPTVGAPPFITPRDGNVTASSAFIAHNKIIVRKIGKGFSHPAAVAVDQEGNVYVADTGNGAIKEVSRGGSIRTIGHFDSPRGVAVDKNGRVYVVDLADTTVRVISRKGVRSLGGGFSQPWGVAVDASSDIFVADTGNDEVKEIRQGAVSDFTSTFMGRGVAVDAGGNVFYDSTTSFGYVDEIAASGVWSNLTNGVGYPWGLAVDSNSHLYVTFCGGCYGAQPGVLDVYDPNTQAWTDLAEGFVDPGGVAADGPGKHVYVADLGNATYAGAVWEITL